MQPGGILEAALYADDLEAAEAFYTGVLGLSVLARVEGRHVFFRCGLGVVLLFNPEATAVPPPEARLPVPPQHRGKRGRPSWFARRRPSARKAVARETA